MLDQKFLTVQRRAKSITIKRHGLISNKELSDEYKMVKNAIDTLPLKPLPKDFIGCLKSFLDKETIGESMFEGLNTPFGKMVYVGENPILKQIAPDYVLVNNGFWYGLEVKCSRGTQLKINHTKFKHFADLLWVSYTKTKDGHIVDSMAHIHLEKSDMTKANAKNEFTLDNSAVTRFGVSMIAVSE